MENQNFFPFGKFLLVLKKKRRVAIMQRYKTLEKEKYAESFEDIKKHVFQIGGISLNKCYALFIGGPEEVFGFFPKDETPDKKEDVFFWACGRWFIIEVVSSLDNVLKKAVCPKLFLVFDKEKGPYYFRLQAWAPVLEGDATKEEIMNIKKFEKGLGVIYDSVRLKVVK
ncbi:MAG: hypothetical protein KBF62_01870 [Candidatus Pacebacteria bacterium]|jgi:hypothetical protein|nr:hypothetical protein [Candidatus Paceibacterota bacterium]MBP9058366.1 hypothetical protein [Candidatus Paceibacterota bacterium]MBP9770076.1 hypothetical protein [Candidatus Paceibacterota bacterium]